MLINSQNIPNAVWLSGGLWDRRIKDSIEQWAKKVSDGLLLDGFRNRPGIQAWIGEHAGKFLDGAIMINGFIGDKALWDKIDNIVNTIILYQEPNGYIGTYLPETRWQRSTGNGWADPNCSWDVWVHKYCILGLIKYFCVRAKDEKILKAAMRAADLLIDVFGENGVNNLNCSDCMAGLASGSILEPIMMLYGITGERRYLDFGSRIVNFYWANDTEGTPNLIEKITDPAGLRSIGTGKSYEMMSCFVGLIEYARHTSQAEFLDKVIAARNNIAAYYRQINGSMSANEHWGEQYIFSERDFLENCVAFTWIQMNSRLFELTGDQKCLEYIEESAYNHIMVSICPDASTWLVYLKLTGPKDFVYLHQISGSGSSVLGGSFSAAPYREAPVTCCHTNGQRALGLIPHYVYTIGEGGIWVNLLFGASAVFDLMGQGKVVISQNTDFPRSGHSILTVTAEYSVTINVRMPYWSTELSVDGRMYTKEDPITLEARAGVTHFTINADMELRLLSPGYVNRGKYAIAYGPLVFAVDSCPGGWRFDEIALAIDKDNLLGTVKIIEENGWPKIIVKAFRIPDGVCELKWRDVPYSLPSAEVTLRPLMFAGLGSNLAYSQMYEYDTLPYDRMQGGGYGGGYGGGMRGTAEYRVMYPCFFI